MDPASLKAAGWAPIEADGFAMLAGPFWWRGTAGAHEHGFVVAPHHGNHIETVHGGVLMTLADNCLGHAVVDVLGGAHCATVQLQIHFIAVARMGEFVTCRPEIIRRSAPLVFMRGLISTGERIVASADGIWKVLEPRVQS
jgi:acyl-coenzyme A thioesterase PaaI-like protein